MGRQLPTLPMVGRYLALPPGKVRRALEREYPDLPHIRKAVATVCNTWPALKRPLELIGDDADPPILSDNLRPEDVAAPVANSDDAILAEMEAPLPVDLRAYEQAAVTLIAAVAARPLSVARWVVAKWLRPHEPTPALASHQRTGATRVLTRLRRAEWRCLLAAPERAKPGDENHHTTVS